MCNATCDPPAHLLSGLPAITRPRGADHAACTASTGTPRPGPALPHVTVGQRRRTPRGRAPPAAAPCQPPARARRAWPRRARARGEMAWPRARAHAEMAAAQRPPRGRAAPRLLPLLPVLLLVVLAGVGAARRGAAAEPPPPAGVVGPRALTTLAQHRRLAQAPPPGLGSAAALGEPGPQLPDVWASRLPRCWCARARARFALGVLRRSHRALAAWTRWRGACSDPTPAARARRLERQATRIGEAVVTFDCRVSTRRRQRAVCGQAASVDSAPGHRLAAAAGSLACAACALLQQQLPPHTMPRGTTPPSARTKR